MEWTTTNLVVQVIAGFAGAQFAATPYTNIVLVGQDIALLD
jgi:hypothetical protein